MSEAFSKTFDCEASPEFGAKFAVVQERLNAISVLAYAVDRSEQPLWINR